MPGDRTVRKVVVGVGGASGAVYAKMFIDRLLSIDSVERIAVVFSGNGRDIYLDEAGALPQEGPRLKIYDNTDFYAPFASGSSDYDAAVVVPCSMGLAARIASGVSDCLISRACDVMLKERRPLIVVPRETPLSLIHLRNLTALTEAGAVALPACPSFYSGPQSVEALCNTVVERIVSLLFPDQARYKWGAF